MSLILTGCGSDSVDDLFAEPTWPGTYAATGTWNLGGPFAGGRTPGDAVAELVIDSVVTLSGVPGPLEDSVRDAVASQIHDDIAGAVDANAPADLAPQSELVQTLSAVLATVQIDSEIQVEEGLLPRSLEGLETIQLISFEHDSTTYEIAIADLLGSAGANLSADWEGSGNNETLDIDEHPVLLRYGELVKRIAETLFATTVFDSIRDDVQSALSCGTIVSLILGGETEFGISVSDWSYAWNASELDSACGSARSLIGGKFLGLFEMDSRVEVGGDVHLSDTDGDGSVDHFQSATDFGGTLNVVPKAIAPRVLVTFEAHRI